MNIKFIINNSLMLFNALITALSLGFSLDLLVWTTMADGLLFLFKNEEFQSAYYPYPQIIRITKLILIYELEIFPILSYCNHFKLTEMVHIFWWILVAFLLLAGKGFIEYSKSQINIKA